MRPLFSASPLWQSLQRLVLAVTLAFASLAGSEAFCTESGIIAPGAKVELLADGFRFTEGPERVNRFETTARRN